MRSHKWFLGDGIYNLAYRAWMKNQGLPDHLFDGRPVIGICNSWSELTPCNAHLRDLADHVKRGVFEAGGFPVEFPVMSLSEPLMRPSTMLYRNLCSMEVEESIRAHPIDAVVLLVGCDKTTPALLMGAASVDLPTIVVSGGPMLNGRFRGECIGSGTHLWKFIEMQKRGELDEDTMREAEAGMSRSAGHCMSMGTASTMASIVETLGIALPNNAAIPAVDSRRRTLAHMAGRRIVELARDDVRLSRILTRRAFENAIVACAALGGSSNAIVHLLALAGRLGVPLELEDWDQVGRGVPCLANLMPSGEYLMEEFYYAGGLAALLEQVRHRLHLDVPTVSGRTLGENIAGAPVWDSKVIRGVDEPVAAEGGFAVLRGNLAPGGAVMKLSAASPALMKHRGPAVVFENIDDYRRRIDDPALVVDEQSILLLKSCGPRGYPGFPEVGNFALPAKLLRRGVKDMIRISDARMSGTAYGTIVLHAAPEAALGGPMAIVRDGDMIELDVPGRRLHLDLPAAEIEARRASWQPPLKHSERGWMQLYWDHVLQADRGADLDFLVGGSGAEVARPGH